MQILRFWHSERSFLSKMVWLCLLQGKARFEPVLHIPLLGCGNPGGLIIAPRRGLGTVKLELPTNDKIITITIIVIILQPPIQKLNVKM